VVVPSRQASDPKHDAALVRHVRFLGSDEAAGLSGHRLYVELPPPPRVIETLLPEVRAALDENVRQDDLEASLYEEATFEVEDEEFTDRDPFDDFDYPLSPDDVDERLL
jgi:hypothetical protein